MAGASPPTASRLECSVALLRLARARPHEAMKGSFHTMGGGLLATIRAMSVTYLAGWALSLTGWLSDAWAHVTPGQAAILIGLLHYATHHAPKFLRRAGVRGLCDRLAARLGPRNWARAPDGKKELLGFAAVTVAAYILGVCALALAFHVLH
jgi:hypothetical protein